MTRRAAVAAAVVLALVVAGELGRRTLAARAVEAEARRRDELAAVAQRALQQGAPKEALDALRALEQVDPLRAGLTSSLGRALVATGAASEALPVLERALQRDGPTPSVLEDQAVALAQLGRHDEARAALERAVMMDEGRPSALRRLAQANLILGEVDRAVASWEKALQVAPVPERDAIKTEASTLLAAAGYPDAGVREPLPPSVPGQPKPP
ncbi:MAG: tetratricopeptide repeat protein [Myxococcaceae bacterium]|nr:tetratricopeptide repeat protein [Myxococcaceae bacterium]MCA3016178.1 tetratricopeptide repeat protein [Myxococcaceae bacterium]